MKARFLIAVVVVAVLGGAGWGVRRIIQVATASTTNVIPTTHVKKGRVTITVSARGELQGGNSEILTAPMTGGQDMAITSLRDTGELVNPGDTIVQFDTTQQEYNLREAEADLAEAEQQVMKAEADGQASLEEARYQTISTAADVKTAELEVRKNPMLATISARQNDISLESAKNRQQQAERDLKNLQATSGAGVAIQRANESKAKLMADMARRTIESMTLKAKTGGYVNVQQNTNQNLMYSGMTLPQFQNGDTARAGQSVAQIPDMSNWEVVSSIQELDRGYLSPDQKVTVHAAALAGREFRGHIKALGGTSGNAWNRRFECRVALDETGPELRPGMSVNLQITVESLDNVLWLPSQALFERDGHAFVYLKTPQGVTPKDVTLVRRGESQAVITGLNEGDEVSLSSPDQDGKTADPGQSGVMKALPK
ncbi:MAG: efflux RND transporter periplasmic adaptor subunit [Acidobacteriia bacterium]|nr:efflux RND transporter periplasmic adaptor subunit [Terriglobia bacterium]